MNVSNISNLVGTKYNQEIKEDIPFIIQTVQMNTNGWSFPWPNCGRLIIMAGRFTELGTVTHESFTEHEAYHRKSLDTGVEEAWIDNSWVTIAGNCIILPGTVQSSHIDTKFNSDRLFSSRWVGRPLDNDNEQYSPHPLAYFDNR